MLKFIRRFDITNEAANVIRAELAACGAYKCRVKRNTTGSLRGSARVVIDCVENRDKARDAFVMLDLMTTSGDRFTLPSTRHAWNGPVEITVWASRPL